MKLIKAKALPIGTKRKNPDGSWRVKTGKGWEYYAKGKLPKKYAIKTKSKKKIIKKVIKPVNKTKDIENFLKKPSLTAYRKQLKERFDNAVGMYKVRSVAYWKSFAKATGIKTWSDLVKQLDDKKKLKNLSTVLFEKLEDPAVEKPHPLNNYMYPVYDNLVDVLRDAFYSTLLLSDKERKNSLYGRGISATSKGMRIYISDRSGDAYEFKVLVPFSEAEKSINLFFSNDFEREHNIKRLKSSSFYKEWKLNNNDKLKDAIKHFEKTTGLIFRNEVGKKKGAMPTPVRIKTLEGIFKNFSKHLNMKNYTPPDGKKLNVRINGAVKGAAGTYTEYDHTINISPTYPGTITHEMGHYFWYRNPKMQKDFIEWMDKVGLTKKINEAVNKKGIDSAEYQSLVRDYYRSTYSMVIKNIDFEMKVHGFSRDDSKLVNRVASYINGAILHLMEESSPEAMSKKDNVNSLVNKTYKAIGNATDEQLRYMSFQLKSAYPEWSVSHTDIENDLKEFMRHKKKDFIIRSVRDISRIYGFSGIYYRVANRNKIEMGRYTNNKRYWSNPNEAFARSFRNYIAMKSGVPLHKTSKESSEHFFKKNVDVNKFAHGWDFPEVSPQEDMLKKGFDKIINKYIGKDVIKSIFYYMEDLAKSKYVRRWKGKNGKWQYDYNKTNKIKPITEVLGKPITLLDLLAVRRTGDMERYNHLKVERKKYEQKVDRYINRITSNARAIKFERPDKEDIKYIVHPSSREKGKWQISSIGIDGKPFNHLTFDTKKEAIESAIGLGKNPMGSLHYGISNILKSKYVIFIKRKPKNASIKQIV